MRDLAFGKVEEDCDGIFQLSRTVVLADDMGWHVQVCHLLFSTITSTCTCTCFLMKVEGKKLVTSVSALNGIPQLLRSATDVKQALTSIDSCVLCRGHDDQRFITYILSKKGKIMDPSGMWMHGHHQKDTHAYTHIYMHMQTHTCTYTHNIHMHVVCYFCAGTCCVAFFDETHSTIRCCDCELLVVPDGSSQAPCCNRCKAYRNNLRALVNRAEKEREEDVTKPSSHTPFRYLNTPEKAKRYQQEHKLRRSYEHRLARLTQRLAEAVEERGFTEDSTLSNDLSQIMEHNAKSMQDTYPSGTFARIFWESQSRAASLKDPRQMRWDPMMVRWCLYLRHLSSSAYEVVRESGAIRLPSQRTLRDYTYHTKAVAGFSRGVDEQLRIAAKLPHCPEREKCVIIVFDEMHLREDLSYDKHTGKMSNNMTSLSQCVCNGVMLYELQVL